MQKLIQTSECSIIYGTDNEERFRCPRALDNTDISRYVNEHRCLVCPMESDVPFVDDDTDNLHSDNLIGYWRMYWRNGYWDGRWILDSNAKLDKVDAAGVNVILDYIYKHFPTGCSGTMKKWCAYHFKTWDGMYRYLIKPYMSDIYKVLIDTTYGNGDYPVRIYVYEKER